jgi:hypothetical protein
MPRGRPPKIAPVPYEIARRLEEITRRVQPECLPQNAELLAYTWIAMTERIGRIAHREYPIWRLVDTPNPPSIKRLKEMVRVGINYFRDVNHLEYQHVHEHIVAITMLEALDVDLVTLEERHRLINEELDSLIHATASEENHTPATIKLQRDCLIHFLRREACPTETRRGIDWIKSQWPILMALVSMWHCRCGKIHTIFADFDSRATPFSSLPLTTAAELILAHVHGISEKNVQRLCGKS